MFEIPLVFHFNNFDLLYAKDGESAAKDFPEPERAPH
jgi:hypothetical protein